MCPPHKRQEMTCSAIHTFISGLQIMLSNWNTGLPLPRIARGFRTNRIRNRLVRIQWPRAIQIGLVKSPPPSLCACFAFLLSVPCFFFILLKTDNAYIFSWKRWEKNRTERLDPVSSFCLFFSLHFVFLLFVCLLFFCSLAWEETFSPFLCPFYFSAVSLVSFFCICSTSGNFGFFSTQFWLVLGLRRWLGIVLLFCV